MRKRTLLLVALIIAVAAVGIYLISRQKSDNPVSNNQYIDFTDSYVFNIPKNFSIDEKTVPGILLAYPSSSQIVVKSIDDAYPQGMISIQALNTLKDHSSQTFKKYIDGTFTTAMKKIGPDVKVNYDKKGQWDLSKVTVKKNGQIVRFAYLINDKHQAIITGESETPAVKNIEQTIVDIEDSGLNDEQKIIRKAIDKELVYLKVQKAQDLYSNASSDLRAKNSLNDVANALNTAKPMLQNTITFFGVVYSGQAFSVGLNFWNPQQQTFTPVAYGTLLFIKENNVWKLQQFSLPSA